MTRQFHYRSIKIFDIFLLGAAGYRQFAAKLESRETRENVADESNTTRQAPFVLTKRCSSAHGIAALEVIQALIGKCT
jgi:hypothetical protein